MSEALKLWQPTQARIDAAQSTAFIKFVAEKIGKVLKDFRDLYAWSIEDPEDFWRLFAQFSEIKFTEPATKILADGHKMPGARWFVGGKLNYAENLIEHGYNKTALIFIGENEQRRTLSYPELAVQVRAVAIKFREWGITSGDRVAAVVANVPEAIVCALAAAAVGAVWSSCSPDFGVEGIVDRFQQINPKILVVVDGYFYKGIRQELGSKIVEVVSKLPSLKKGIVIDYIGTSIDFGRSAEFSRFEDISVVNDFSPFCYEPCSFDHPLFILYSSGTTGKPKCIVHGVGGALLEHVKEHLLHVNLRSDDVLFYQTTYGWMMWNWLLSGLYTGATLVLYDGFPLLNEGRILWEIAEKEEVTIFGTNAKYLSLIEKSGIKPAASFDLKNLHTILSTGSTLLPGSFDFVYRDIKSDICLSSISGGTDILGCFALGSPVLPVYRSELQTRSLALKVEVLDSEGKLCAPGEKGELTCAAPFPSMPVGFWKDQGGAIYQKAYFERFPNRWYHGDYVELTKHGGMVFHGRSDATLNPGGVRVGTAEIYQQVEKLPQILEAVVVGQLWKGDERLVLFVKLQPGCVLDLKLKDEISKIIRLNTSVYHVPKKIVAVSDIPRTRSNKIVELAIKRIVNGESVDNVEALLNPEALKLIEEARHKELAED